MFGVQVARCGRLITGQNPPSAKPTAEAIIAALEVAKMTPPAATAAATTAAVTTAALPPPPDEEAAPSPLRRSSDPPPPADDGLRFSASDYEAPDAEAILDGSAPRVSEWAPEPTAAAAAEPPTPPSPVDEFVGAAVAVTDAVNAAASATGDTLASLVFGVAVGEKPKGESTTRIIGSTYSCNDILCSLRARREVNRRTQTMFEQLPPPRPCAPTPMLSPTHEYYVLPLLHTKLPDAPVPEEKSSGGESTSVIKGIEDILVAERKKGGGGSGSVSVSVGVGGSGGSSVNGAATGAARSARHGSGLGLNGHAPPAVSGGGLMGGHFAPVNKVKSKV